MHHPRIIDICSNVVTLADSNHTVYILLLLRLFGLLKSPLINWVNELVQAI